MVWGDDQYENFREDVIPPYCIYAHESFEFAAACQITSGTSRRTRSFALPGHVTAAKYLARGLIEAGFDTAYSYKPLHHPLGHAFANAVLYLDYDRKGFPYPIIPFAINCYGRRVIAQRGGLPVFENPPSEAHLDPPAPTPAATVRSRRRHCAHLRGESLARRAAGIVGLVARVPHREEPFSLSGHAGRSASVRCVARGQLRRVAQLSSRLGGGERAAGNPELDVPGGALEELERKPAETEFIDTWIFNSSKCFLTAPPPR